MFPSLLVPTWRTNANYTIHNKKLFNFAQFLLVFPTTPYYFQLHLDIFNKNEVFPTKKFRPENLDRT